MSRWRRFCGFAAVLSLCAAAAGQDKGGQVLALVNGAAISQRQVNREIDRALAERKLTGKTADQARRALAKPTLELLVRRQLVLDGLRRDGLAASDAEVGLAVERLKRELGRRQMTLEDHLKQTGQTTGDLAAELAWQLSWQRLVAAELTDEAVEKFFNRHRRHFDGAQLRVSHILFALPKMPQPGEVEAATKAAAAVRAEIAAGKLSFAEAAARHSAAPTKDAGGDIGFISRHGEQHEAFAQAAFSLPQGEVSEPIRTPHGIHLIRWTEEKAGRRTLAEVREEVRQAAATEIFEKRAKKERPAAKIEYPPGS